MSDSSRPAFTINIRAPPTISTQERSEKSIDSAVAMSNQHEELGGLVTQSEDEAKPDSRPNKTWGESPGTVIEPSSDAVQGEGSGTNEPQTANSKHGDPSAADISTFMKTFQKIIQSSSTNITVEIKGEGEDSDQEGSSNDGAEEASENDSDESKSLAQSYPNVMLTVEKELSTGTCRCTICINEKKHPEKRIAHAVEFIDEEDYVLITEDRDKPLDLSTERKKVDAKRLFTVFTVATVVKTSIPKNLKIYFPAEFQAMVKKNLLTNKDIEINFKTLKLFIVSPAIIQALRSVILYYPDLVLRSDRLSFTSPFAALAHHADDLREYRDRLLASKEEGQVQDPTSQQKPAFPPDHESMTEFCNAKAAEHVSMLLDYLEDSYGDKVQAEVARNGRGLCTFAMLWMMLKPGTTVYVRSRPEEVPSAMVIKSVEEDPAIIFRNDNERAPYKIRLWHLDFDGRRVGRRLQEKTLIQFDGEREITSLQVFPCHFLDRQDNASTRKQVIERGKKWYGLLKGKMFNGRVYVDSTSYWGDGTDEAPPSLGSIDNDPSNIGGCTCSVCTSKRSEAQLTRLQLWKGYEDIDPFDIESLELEDRDTNTRLGIDKNHRYLICTPVIGGLVLKKRTWEKLDTAYCSEVQPRDKAIDNLVLTKSRKDMIKALLHNYSMNGSGNPGKVPDTWSADFIEDKGDGRIFLLHGPPGVGKTYTAECIAEYTGRPLISLTCGDIGTEEEDVEKHLQKWFALGEKWGAVMLIDEADVYLETRQPGDLKRNGLVSVFLRAVEYYKGILFLTTNRVGQFDDAFMSRIHVILRYDRLNLEDRKKIWEGFFEKLEKDRGRQMRITKRARQYVLEDKEMTQIPWNGREIRNAFQTAVALAQYQFAMLEDKEDGEKAMLDREHFEEVCAMATHFKDYLKNVHMADEEERRLRRKDGL
ncbi:ATPase family AAA domain-containing protein 3 [Cytospora mali]|uniref:ATPase family AAA domain-containing protein 3 n=1 Tax=Cytospora mali TaxID=578113 RepID=A0A194VXF3_CYTMA|nr:ATPase family AAA domain-containing protein 3 [Valsa mali]